MAPNQFANLIILTGVFTVSLNRTVIIDVTVLELGMGFILWIVKDFGTMRAVGWL